MKDNSTYLWSLVLIGLCQFLLIADFSSIGVSLPAIGRDLQIAPAVMSRVVSAADTSYAGFLIFCGRLADLLGPRRSTMIALTCFAVGAVLSALSPSIWPLLAARTLTGMSSALLTPCVFLLINALARDGQQRHTAVSVFGIASGIGAICGMLLGGLLTTMFGWRSVFLLHIPVVFAALLLVWRLVPVRERKSEKIFANAPSAAMITIASGLVIYSISLIGRADFRFATQLLLAAMTCYAAFYVLESRSSKPLVARSIYTPNLAINGLSLAAVVAAATGAILLNNLYMQSVLKFEAVFSGLGMLPYAIAGITASFLLPTFLARVSTKVFAGVGILLVNIGLALLLSLAGAMDYFTSVFWGSMLDSVGVISAQMAVILLVTANTASSNQGLVTAVLFSCCQMGASFGATVCLSAAGRHADSPAGVSVAGFENGYLWALCFAAVAMVLAILPQKKMAIAEA